MRPPPLASILGGFRLRKNYAHGSIQRELDEDSILRVGVRPLGRPSLSLPLGQTVGQIVLLLMVRF
jgi:hypothetical protein